MENVPQFSGMLGQNRGRERDGKRRVTGEWGEGGGWNGKREKG